MDPEHLTLSLLRSLTDVSAAAGRVIGEVFEGFELTESAAALLWALDQEPPPASMREIARLLGCDPSNVTLMSDRLHRAGLVERRPHPTDGRSRLLALTPQGLELLGKLRSELHARSPLGALTRKEQQRLDVLLAKARGVHPS